MGTEGKVGLTGGYNLADQYYKNNHTVGHWKVIDVKLPGRGIQHLTMSFLEMGDVISQADNYYEKYTRAS